MGECDDLPSYVGMYARTVCSQPELHDRGRSSNLVSWEYFGNKQFCMWWGVQWQLKCFECLLCRGLTCHWDLTAWYIVDAWIRQFQQLYGLHRQLLFTVFRKVLLSRMKFEFDVLNQWEYTVWLTNAPADQSSAKLCVTIIGSSNQGVCFL